MRIPAIAVPFTLFLRLETPMAQLRIRDIAEQAGVSPATVSRYLNNRPGQMTEATRARIAEVIERTGYRPRSAARNLRSARSGLVGVVMADVSNPYSSAMLECISDRAAERGYSIMTAFSGGRAESEASALERLIDGGVDGLIVNTCGGNDGAVAAASGRVPTVLLDRPAEGVALDVVTSNNSELMARLVAELTGAGCRVLRLLTEEGDTSAVRRIRSRAFRDAAESASAAASVLALSPDASIAARQVDACIAEAAGERLGLIAVNGLVFLRLIEALTQMGPLLPAGMALATFDEYPWNRVLFGGVTTAAQDTAEISRVVIDRLMMRIDVALTAVGESARIDAATIEVPGWIESRATTSRC